FSAAVILAEPLSAGICSAGIVFLTGRAGAAGAVVSGGCISASLLIVFQGIPERSKRRKNDLTHQGAVVVDIGLLLVLAQVRHIFYLFLEGFDEQVIVLGGGEELFDLIDGVFNDEVR